MAAPCARALRRLLAATFALASAQPAAVLVAEVATATTFRLGVRFGGWSPAPLASPSINGGAPAPSTPVSWGGMRGVATSFGALLTDGAARWALYDAANNTLVASGAWVETCSPLAAQSAFCVRGSELDLQHGSFAVVANVSSPPGARAQRRKLRLLLRCVTVSSSARHFFSLDPACEGVGEPDAQLGWLAERPDDEMLRPLRRCVDADGLRVHALDKECDDPFTADPLYPSVLGYVQ